ncbi:MAG: YfjI family protein [Chlamydiota bacterium]|jgi:hypothetical protein
MTTSFHNLPAPIPLGAPEIPPFPEGVFPETIERFISKLSKSTETPRDLPALTVLAILATASHDKYTIQVKPDYSESVNLWTAVALPPGSRKSAILGAAIKPIEKYEKQKQLEITSKIKEINSRNKSIEVRIKEKRSHIAKAKVQDFDSLQKEIYELEQQIKPPPPFPQLWTSDVTPENLASLMVINNECMSILSDEAGIFDILAGRYSSGIPNLDLFLKSHSGASARVNRTGREPDFLEKAILTMGLTPQPEVLKKLGTSPSFRGRGLLGRFLYALPNSSLGMRELNAPPLPIEVQQSYNDVIEAILSHQTEAKSHHALHLTEKAYDKWLNYSRVIEIKMGEGGPFELITDWAGKLPGQIARMAALIHIARYAYVKPWLEKISEKDMLAAIKIGHFFAEHAIAVFDLMETDPSIEGVRVILRWIEKNKLSQFTFRDCHYAHKSRFKKAIDMESCIKILEDKFYIQEQEVKKQPHRNSRIFIVNEKLFSMEG